MTKTAFSYGFLLVLALVLALAHSCQEDEPTGPTPFVLEVPPHFPQPEIPANNTLTAERVALGKKLFFEKALSRDSSLSCASCHPQHLAFADDNAISIGVKDRMGFRNVPTLTNVAYHPYFFREGGSPTLEAQVLGPICNFDEMGFNARELANRLKTDETYETLAQEAYGRSIDLWVVTRAIAAYERTMISGNSRWDQYYLGDENALTESEKRGWELFSSERAACTQCHSGFDFSDYSFQNIGTHQEYKDLGRARVTVDSADIGKFKVPTLRNVELTGPYMHDGSFTSLEEVVAFLSQGGVGHFNQSEYVKPLNFTSQEQTDLVNFLKSLTDHDFVTDPAFRE
jgi:cytochrome c peroxidase